MSQEIQHDARQIRRSCVLFAAKELVKNSPSTLDSYPHYEKFSSLSHKRRLIFVEKQGLICCYSMTVSLAE